MSEEKSNSLSEALDKACSVAAFEKNIRREYHAGKTAKGTQHFAIAINTLKRACGVNPKERETSPKKIVAMGKGKTEDNMKFGPGAKGRSPFRLPPVERGDEVPIHRNAKSGKEQPFLDPEDFTLSASGTVRDKKTKSKKAETYSSLVAWLDKEGGGG
jgi:hypothetical protein